VDRDGHFHAVLLSLHRFLGAHSGLNQADHLWQTITDYEIAPFVGMFNVDNATNNDLALVVLAERLSSAGYPSFDPVADRLRCFSHVINLVVKRILWGTDIYAYEGERLPNRADIEEVQHWRRVGPLGKLHNTLTYILKTPQRCDTFEEIVRRLYVDETVFMVFVGNITCWSSDYESILRAFRLREAIDEFTNMAICPNVNGERNFNHQEALVHNELLPRDWEFLASVKEILAPFKEWTFKLQV
jgi:hypothetical protein